MTDLEKFNLSGTAGIGTTEPDAPQLYSGGGIMTIFDPLPEEETVLKAGTAESEAIADNAVLIDDLEEKVREAWDIVRADGGTADKPLYATSAPVPETAASVSDTTSAPAAVITAESAPAQGYVSGAALYTANVSQDGTEDLLAGISGAWVPGSGINYSSSNDTSAYKKLAFTMPQAEYTGGCTATSVGMLFAYYDLYGYCGFDASNLIEGTVEVFSRDSNIYDMDNESVLGQFIASGLRSANTGYYFRFFGTTPEHELPYTYVTDAQGKVVLGGDGELQLNTDEWDCLADWMGTGQYYRANSDYSSSYM